MPSWVICPCSFLLFFFSSHRLSSNICALIATKVIFTVHAHHHSFVPEPIKICGVAVFIVEDKVTTFSLHLVQNTGAKTSLCSRWIASVCSAVSACSRAAAAATFSPRTPAWSRSPRPFSSGWCAAGGRPRAQRGGADPCGTGSLCAHTDASGSLPAGCWPRSPGCGRHLCQRHLSLGSVSDMTACDESGGGGGREGGWEGGSAACDRQRLWCLCKRPRGGLSQPTEDWDPPHCQTSAEYHQCSDWLCWLVGNHFNFM